MNIRLYSKDFKLSEEDKEYITAKIQMLTKYYDGIIQADMEVGMTTHRSQKGEIFRAELNLQVPGKLLRVEKTTTNLYKSIDKVKDHMARELSEYNEKRQEKRR